MKERKEESVEKRRAKRARRARRPKLCVVLEESDSKAAIKERGGGEKAG